ncbi:class I SAM-dependent methyltransferase [Brevibacillus fortis]|uniref:class I SAM-dependent methyltransferase n=1 Tax=Brevibacillus fortis TaxID=2126352 RepID=UPI002E20441E|nr:class I SAM-dependent methyltransferase [Brevibacillus fortis]
MNFKELESSTKLRGGYYTPTPVAEFLARWVLNQRPSTVLEPSCGDGSFIRAVSAHANYNLSFSGIELMDEEAEKSRMSLHGNLHGSSTVITADFLDWSNNELDAQRTFDAVVGNPPYIRYQYLEEKDQLLAAQLFHRYQLKFTKHTNAWVPFVIASIGLLAPGGRLAMVIPSEILHVLHANSLRSYLLQESHRILIIDPTELLFEEALQGTVLLMVEKKIDPQSRSEGVAIVAAENNDFLTKDPESFYRNATYISGDVLNGKWMRVLLSPVELAVYRRAIGLPQVHKFKNIATVDVGIVTGANKFFLVDDSTVEKYRLDDYVKPMFGRSEHCPGIIYDNRVHSENKIKKMPTNFIALGGTPFESLKEDAQKYVLLGESQSLHTRYKCRIRKPWYAVPSVYSTPIGMLKRSHNFPRLILNTLGAYTTDTAYRIKTFAKDVTDEKLVFCFINSLTALTAELEGRHYGGGVLELVPSEIEKVLVPIPTEIKVDVQALNEKIITSTAPEELLAGQDNVILRAIGLSEQDCSIIQQAWRRMRNRRHRRVENENDNGDG